MEEKKLNSISNQTVNALFEDGPYILFHWKNESNWPVLFVSTNVEQILGYNEEDFYVQKISYSELIHPLDIDRVQKEVKSFSENNASSFSHHPYRIFTKDQRWLWIHEHTTIVRDTQTGEITGYLGIVHDITIQHKNILQLRENEEKLNTIIDFSPVAISMYDQNMTIMVANKKWKKTFLQDKPENKNYFAVFPETPERWKRIFQKCLQGISGYGDGEMYYREDGQSLRLRWQIQPWFNNHGEVAGIIHFVEDVTNEWLSLQEEKHIQQTLSSIFNNLNAAIYVADMNTYELLFANHYLTKNMGNIEGKKCWEVLHQGMTGPCSFCNNERLISHSGIPTGVINWEYYSKSTGKWFAISDVAIEWKPRKIVRLSVSYDITTIKNTEISLNQSEKRYRQIFESNQAIKMLIDRDNFRIIDANEAACKFYGYEHSQLTQMKFIELLAGESEFVKNHLKNNFQKKRFYLQLSQQTKNNNIREIEIYAGPVEMGGKSHLYAIIHDITDRKNAQWELAKRDQILYAVSQSAQILLKIDELEKAIPLTLEILGKATQVSCVCLFKNIKPEQGELFAERQYIWHDPNTSITPEAMQLAQFPYMRLGLKDWITTLFGGELILANVDNLSEKEQSLFKALQVSSFLILPINTAASWWGFIGFFVKEIDKKWSFFESELLKSGAGIIGYAIERHKILEELKYLNKNLETKVKEQLEENRKKDHMLIAQSRLAGIGEMMGNIAHQWRQPITVISLIFQELKDSFKYGELNEEKMLQTEKEVKEIVEHLSATIDDFRDFYKPTKTKTLFYIVRDSLNRVMSFVQTRLAKLNVKLVLKIEEDVQISGYPGEYSQVFLNIINNAIDVFIERKILDPELTITMEKKENRSLLTVSDNAGGIDTEIITKIFDPYFTTKDKGTGIGLYMSKMIIEQSMEGKLTVANHAQGACFYILV